VSDDLPEDVSDTLVQLLSEAESSARTGNRSDVLPLLNTVEKVVTNKLPPGQTREQLLHGCDTVRPLLGHEPLVAAEYLRSMCRTIDRSRE